MRPFTGMRALTAGAALFSMIPAGVFGADVLSTTGFSTCLDDSEIKVDKLDISYNKNTRKLTFNVAGESKSAQNVTANLVVTAYGKEVYSKEFSPCDEGMTEMCPGTNKLWYMLGSWSANSEQYLLQSSNLKASKPYLKNSPNRFPQ